MKPTIIRDTERTKLLRAWQDTRQALSEADHDTAAVMRLCIALDDLEFYAASIRQDLSLRKSA